MLGPHDDLKVEVSQYVSYFQCWLGYPNHDSKKKKKDVSFLNKENTHSSLKRLTFLGCRGSPSLQTKQKGLALGCVCAQVCPTQTVAHQAPLSMGLSQEEYWSE